MAAGAWLLRHRRRHGLRGARQDRAARLRRRGEGPVREGAAAQGVLPQRPGRGIPRRVLEDLELPRRTTRTAPRRRQVTMSIITRLIGDKRRWRQYKARTRQLPASYHTAIDALERYLMCFGPGDGGTAASMFEDLADLFEQSAASGTPVRAIVGEDPVEFAET